MVRCLEPGLTLCAIVKNEESALPRLLASVKGIVDEIVIVDTGSTDRTVEIAKQHGATVLFHPFADDFSAPRNTGLAAATRTWILVLDADEVLKDGSKAAIRDALRSDRVAGYYLEFWNDLGGERIHRCGLMRLFRNDPSIRFDFCLHEQVLPSLIEFARARSLKLAPLSGAVVLHDGYRQEKVDSKAKDERNLRLYRKQIALYPDNAYSWYKFGDFLRRFPERAKESRAALERSSSLIEAMPSQQSKELSYAAEVHALLALAAERAGDLESAVVLGEAGLGRFQESANLWFVLGHLHAKRGDHRRSLRDYARLRWLDRRLLAIPPEPGITGSYAYFGMGRALANLGYKRAAMRCVDRSIELDAKRPEARMLRSRLRLEHGDVLGAIEDDRIALAADPKRFSLRVRLSHLLLHRGSFAEARIELERAATDGAELAEIAPKLGIAYLGIGMLEHALDAFQAVPNDPDSRLGIEWLTAVANGHDPNEDARLRERLEARGAAWKHVLAGFRCAAARGA